VLTLRDNKHVENIPRFWYFLADKGMGPHPYVIHLSDPPEHNMCNYTTVALFYIGPALLHRVTWEPSQQSLSSTHIFRPDPLPTSTRPQYQTYSLVLVQHTKSH
jgi:hypothetical protein